MKKVIYPDTPISASSLSSSEKLVVYTIKGLLDGALSKAIPTVELAKAASLSPKTIHTCLKQLEELEWVVIKKNTKGANVYKLAEEKFSVQSKALLDLEAMVNKLIKGEYVKYPKKTKFDDVIQVLNKPGKPKVTGKNNVTSLTSIWKATVPFVFPEITFIKQFTNAQIGQFKQFSIKLGAAANPEEVLAFVIENWSGFCIYVKDKAGITLAPTFPDIGYILKYCDLAVIFMNYHNNEDDVQEEELDEFDYIQKKKTKKGGKP